MGEHSCKCLKYNPKDKEEANFENNNNYINTYSFRNEKMINNTLDISYCNSDTNDRSFFNGIQKIGEITKNPFYEIINPSILNLKNSLPPLNINSKINLINFSSNNKKFLKSSIKLFNEDLFYQGEWSKNYKMNGKGLMYIIQREILFEGLFQNNTFIFGRIYYPDLTYYEGDVINSRKNGYGKIVYNDGCIFKGNFKDDLFDGFGKYTCKLYNYEGEYVCGKKCGKGKESNLVKNTQYEGDFKDDKKNGFGEEKSSDGTIYRGEFKDDLKHGKGTLILDGIKTWAYKGEFKNDKISGKGRFRWNENKEYFGEWENNELSGYGILIDRNYKHIGYFEDSNKHGYGASFFGEESALLGKWENDVVEGNAILIIMINLEQSSHVINDLINNNNDDLNNNCQYVKTLKGEIVQTNLEEDELKKFKSSKEYNDMIVLFKNKIYPDYIQSFEKIKDEENKSNYDNINNNDNY